MFYSKKKNLWFYLRNNTIETLHRERYILSLRKNQWKSIQELKNIQLKKLKAILRHAWNQVPYYHKLFKSAKFKPDDFKDYKDLKKIPITTKKDIQRNYEKALSQEIDLRRHKQVFTSGSTGIPLRVIWDEKTMNYSEALEQYAFLECGVRLNDKIVRVLSTDHMRIHLKDKVSTLRSLAYKIIGMHLNTVRVGSIEALREINPDVIYEYPSALKELVNYDMSGINPRMIFSFGETLTQDCRNAVRNVFNIEINDTYGSVEFNRLAFECNEHCGLHMITDCAVLEFLNDEEPVAVGETGEIVVTGLYNYTMPLIRYELGDLGVQSDDSCSCGRGWPLIKKIEGRKNDFFVLPSGRRLTQLDGLHILSHNVLSNAKLKENPLCVSQLQVVQEKRDKILIKVVKGKEFNKDVINGVKEDLEASFIRLGEDVTVEVEITEDIPKERTGKRRAFISQLHQGIDEDIEAAPHILV